MWFKKHLLLSTKNHPFPFVFLALCVFGSIGPFVIIALGQVQKLQIACLKLN